MIIRDILLLFLLPMVIAEEDSRQYDTNEWIPITPEAYIDDTKKASGRVLNLDVPNQNFFPTNQEYLVKNKRPILHVPPPILPPQEGPNDDYLVKTKRPILHLPPPVLPPQEPPQQYLRETSFPAPSPRRPPPKAEEPYKFEPIENRPTGIPRYAPGAPIRPPPPPVEYVKRPVYQEQQLLSQHLTAPPPQLGPNPYLATPQEYSIPFNNTFYQSLNPGVINREILGAIQNDNVKQISSTTPKAQENVQLLYVPLENLKQPIPQQSQQSHNVYQQQLPPRQEKQHIFDRKQHQIDNIQQDFVRQAIEAQKLQQQIQLGQPILIGQAPISTTTAKPKKRKPHQPPLAVYMGKQGEAAVGDVLKVLKDAKTIAVQDTVGPDTPQIFVGPSNLDAPKGYSKFPLPYLSTVEGNRIERKVDQLPFFVAPLSYKAPEGYSKIPLPSPHVGSVVVKEDHQNEITQNQYITSTPQNSLLDLSKEFLSHYQLDGNGNVVPNYRNYPTTTKELLLQNYNPFDYKSNYEYQTTPAGESTYQSYPTPNYQTPTTYQTPNYPAPTGNFQNNYQQQNLREASAPKAQQYETPQAYANPTELPFVPSPREKIVKTTTESIPKRIVQSPYTVQPQLSTEGNQEAFNQAVNRFEDYKAQYEDSTTPVVTTTARAKKIRQRVKPNPPTVYESTKAVPEHLKAVSSGYEGSEDNTRTTQNDKYTVLEEFPPRPTTTSKYTTEIETISANVYKLGTADQLEPVYIQNPKQHVLSQEALDQQILNGQRIQQLQQQQQQQQQQQEQVEVYRESQDLPPVNRFLPSLINNLQDQSVKPLLNPKLLVPTTEKLTTTSALPYTEEIAELTSKITTTTPQIDTTTAFKRTRGRQRPQTRYNTPTSAPRRAVRTRRPPHTRATTTTTERPEEEATRKTSSINRNHQRFRTRGRPVPANERSSTERHQVTQQQDQRPQQYLIETVNSQDPHSYMQMEHTIDEQEVMTVRNDPKSEGRQDYHQVYSLPQHQDDESSKPVVDVQITHPITERTRESVRVDFSGAHRNDITTRQPPKIKNRARTRSRFATSTPKATTTTTTTEAPKSSEAEEEFYGFIRDPANFRKQALLLQPTTTTEQPTYIYQQAFPQTSPRTIIHIGGEEAELPSEDEPVRFVGEIRPKYQTTTEELADTTTDSPRFRTRSRVRVPEQTQKSTTIRMRSRGKSHFKLPSSVTTRTDDEDVVGGNYPTSYLRNKETTTARSFQITIDPYGDDGDGDQGDQVPYSSLYIPKVVPHPEWVEASALPPPNSLQFEDKTMLLTSEEAAKSAEDIQDETTTEELSTTEAEALTEETTTLRKSRRRGVWKLVKQRPLDHFETAESQNYQSVLNTFQDIPKAPQPTTTTTTTTTESSLFDTLYNIFGITSDSKNATTTVAPIETTTVLPTFPEEITEEQTTVTEAPTTLASREDEDEEKTTQDLPTTLPGTTLKAYEVEPWGMRVVKTSTSTEVSHETEICYKGRCVKSKERS